MDDQTKSQIKPHDEPLFVLKYLGYKTIMPILGLFLLVIFLGLVTFVAPSKGRFDLVLKPALGLCFLLCGILLIDLVLFQEIQLYKDRIVKVWTGIGATEIKLADAMIGSRMSDVLGLGKKAICHSEFNVNWGWLSSIFRLTAVEYQEHFADPNDVKKMNSLLAELSGRRVEEFEQSMTM
jgi:hypothetical protein